MRFRNITPWHSWNNTDTILLYSLMKLTTRLCKSAKNARGSNEKNMIMATRKKVGFSLSARYLPSIPKGVVHSRWSVDVIIVTKVIAMTKSNERKRSARICFGIPFSPKSHRLNRSHCRDRSLLFSQP